MKQQTKPSILAVGLISICFILPACNLFTGAEKGLNRYCPGLKINVNGVSWYGKPARHIYVVSYDPGDQGKVNNYFADRSHGFTGDNPRRYLYIKSNDSAAVANGDSVESKLFEGNKRSATVVYNLTTHRIIIIEDTLK
jgi:hypothetical protein